MEKLENLIQRVQSLYSRGVQSDDTRLRSRHIYHKLKSIRSRLISQKISKKQKISDWSYQYLPCVELVRAPANECLCLPSPGCLVLRTKHPLPRPLTSLSGHIIKSVTSIDGSVIFNPTTFDAVKYNKGSRYGSKSALYYYFNGYIYIINTTAIKVATIVGLFEDPVEVEKFPSICDEDCEDCENCDSALEAPFPIDGDLVDPLIELSAEELIGQFKQSRQDKTNNSTEDGEE